MGHIPRPSALLRIQAPPYFIAIQPMQSLLRTPRSAQVTPINSYHSNEGAREQGKDCEHHPNCKHHPILPTRQLLTPPASIPRPTQQQPANRLLLQGLLSLGLSLLGSTAIASQVAAELPQQTPVGTEIPAPHRTIPTLLVNSIRLPQPAPVAQGASAPSRNPTGPDAEAIEGDSEARLPASSQGNIYRPIRLKSGVTTEDTLTTQDIPMGQGSFARDYVVTLKAQDQVAIDLSSENFDTVVTLMGENGTTLGENDDGPDGGTNSLLFMRITQDGDYVVRVRGFGQAKGGAFKLKLTRLTAVN